MKFNPLEFFLVAQRLAKNGPEDVRVFKNGKFLYASFDNGSEQILNGFDMSRSELLEIWNSFDGAQVLRDRLDAAAE